MTYGYQYNVPMYGDAGRNKHSGFSLAEFVKEAVFGAVMGGLAGAAFYGLDKAIGALLRSAGNKAASGYSKLIEKKDKFGINASNAKPIEGYTDVIVHGAPNYVGVVYNGKLVCLNQRSLAKFLKQDSGYMGGPIRLLSCNTGSTPNGFAQNLSNKMGVEVMAPSDIIWAFPNGELTIGPNQYSNTGHWNIFTPGKH